MEEPTGPETTVHDPVAPLSVRARPRPVTRLNRKVVVGVGVVGAGLTTLLLVQGLQTPTRPLRRAEPPAAGRPAAYPDFLTFGPKSYAELARQAKGPDPTPSGAAVAEAAVPSSTSAQPPEPPADPPAAGATGGPPAPPAAPAAGSRAPRQETRTTPRPAAPQPRPPSKWLFAELAGGGVQQPPFPVPQETSQGQEPAHSRRADGLFPQAVWGTPADPTRVLYRSQVIHGLLQHDVNSDQPGLIRLLVTEAVQDRFGQGHTLLPQYSILLGSQDGTVRFGQSRLGITIDSVELPDGTVVAFQKAKAGDATGATGVTGSVHNHWAQVGISAVLTAALSVGSRAAAGSPTGFQPNLAQDFARDASQSINTTGQQIVRRSLEVTPTITLPHGTPVTVQLSENVSFQTPAATVRK